MYLETGNSEPYCSVAVLIRRFSAARFDDDTAGFPVASDRDRKRPNRRYFIDNEDGFVFLRPAGVHEVDRESPVDAVDDDIDRMRAGDLDERVGEQLADETIEKIRAAAVRALR